MELLVTLPQPGNHNMFTHDQGAEVSEKFDEALLVAFVAGQFMGLAACRY